MKNKVLMMRGGPLEGLAFDGSHQAVIVFSRREDGKYVRTEYRPGDHHGKLSFVPAGISETDALPEGANSISQRTSYITLKHGEAA